MDQWRVASGSLTCPSCGELWNTADNETNRFKCCPNCGHTNMDQVKTTKLNLILKKYSTGKYCGLQKFVVNGVKAIEGDFGMGFDERPDEATEFGCGCRRFIGYGRPKHGVLEKYNLTINDYRYICSQLESALSVGKCQFCA